MSAAGLWVLSTMVGRGEMDGEGEGEGVEVDMEEEEEACRVSCADGDCRSACLLLSAGDGDRGVGGSEEEVREEREWMLDVELWEGVGVRRAGGDGLDVEDNEDTSWWL